MLPNNILIISSRPPEHSADLGLNIMQALQNEGIDVDFLSLYTSRLKNSNIYSIKDDPSPENNHNSYRDRVKIFLKKKGLSHLTNFLKKYFPFLRKKSPYMGNNGIEIRYPDEQAPAISSSELINAIQKEYDLFITLFWENMLTTQSLTVIYEKYHKPILMISPDMAPLTGGCYYFGECNNFQSGCGNCPGLNSHTLDDLTRKNYAIKKSNYAKMNTSFLGNTWMCEHAIKSKILPHNKIYKTELIIDENIFSMQDRSECRKELNIDQNSFCILLRSTKDKRKGNAIMKDAIEILSNKIHDQNNREIVILTVDDIYFSHIFKSSTCKIINFGIVSKKELIRLYNSANVFLCASTDDAGPSMINQSLMCGTPVISHNIGAALDVVVDNMSGFKVKIGDTKELAESLFTLYNLNEKEEEEIRQNSRKIALSHNSTKAFSTSILKIYDKVRNLNQEFN